MPEAMPTSKVDAAGHGGLREWVDHALLRSEVSALRPLCILSALLMGVATLVDTFTLTQPLRPWVLAHDLTSMVASVALAWSSRRWPQSATRIRSSIALVALLLLSNTILTLAVTRDMVVVAHTVVFFAGVARIVTSVRWLIAILLPAAVGCVAVAVGVGTPEQFGNFGVAIVGVLALAIVTVATRRASLTRLATNEYRAVRRRERLMRALAQSRTELDERRRVEAEREDLRAELLHAQKMQAIGTLAGGVAHDMNNILAVVRSSGEVLKEAVEPESEFREDLDTLLVAVQRGADLTRNLLTFARKEKQQSVAVPLAKVMSEVEALLFRTLPKDVTFETHVTAPLTVQGDRSMLDHAVLNLCLNAADAIMAGPRSGVVQASAVRVDVDLHEGANLGLTPGSYCLVSVRDTGVGMTEEVRARAFEPFFSTKPTGKGTGLGLAMVYAAARAHGGAAAIESTPGTGTTVRLYLPALAEEPASPLVDSQRAPLGRGRRVLVVDDEELVRRSTRRLLERGGFRVVEANGGAAALEAATSEPFDVVVLDMVMPGMSGAECFVRLRGITPGVPVVIASGYAHTTDVERLLREPRVRLVEKPFTKRELLEALEETTEATRLPQEAPGP